MSEHQTCYYLFIIYQLLFACYYYIIIYVCSSADRYRVQSDEIDHLWLVTQELVERLKQHHPDIQITLTDPPKLEEFVPFIDEHFKVSSVLISFY